ncbi:uncharacterized protein [Elaeis guineensis]|uniref:uncharacterized protein n=1 Tax=Elaeis guineensis var. tenera TaxID=51953 RepID=UPI003C6CC8FA
MVQKQGIPPLSPNQQRCLEYLKSFFKNIFSQVLKAIVFLLPFIGKFNEIRQKKTENTFAYRVMHELVSKTKWWQFKSDGKKPAKEANDVPKPKKQIEATPVLIAAKRGVIEMVKEILKTNPLAIDETNSDGKNIVLLAAEYGQTDIYKYMFKREGMLSSFGMVDKEGNSALHLAAKSVQKRHWSIPGAAFQMQAEVKWYKVWLFPYSSDIPTLSLHLNMREIGGRPTTHALAWIFMKVYVEKSVRPRFFALYNSEGKLAQKIFTNSHKELMKDARDWLIGTSESCSVVAALVAAVAYTSATSVPGGNDSTGIPMFEGQRAFQVFAMSSLIALCSSVTALVFFLSIVTSRFHAFDFETALPTKLIGGMTTLFVSIAANLISFCAGYFYVIHNELESGLYILYAALSFPVMAFFLTSQVRLYVDLIKASFTREPERSEKRHYF